MLSKPYLLSIDKQELYHTCRKIFNKVLFCFKIKGVFVVKKFLSVLTFLLFMTAGTVSASEPSAELLNDMRANPQNYICIGGAGTGVAIFISKSSVDVQQYSPPKYIISVKWITYSFHRVKDGNDWKVKESARLGKNHRYLYDYNERKIYAEKTEKGTTSWQFLDLSKANGPSVSLMSKDIDAAEFAFYWAYNQCFFGKPLSNGLKGYIENGTGTFDKW